MNDYKTIRDIAEIEEYIGSAGVVSFDFETSPTEKYRSDGKAALDAHKADITGVSLSVKAGTGRYIPLRHRVGKNASLASVMKFLRQRVFQNSKTVKIAHNMAFEALFLYKDGIVLQEPVYDTIVASQLTLKNDFEYRDLGDSGLKTLVPYLYGVELPKFEDVVGDHSFDELDPDAWDTCRYACADSDWALQLYYTFNEWFENNIPKHRLICEKIESPTAVFTGMMKYNGVLFDTDLMEEKKAEAEAHLVDLRAKLQAVIGNVDIGENCGTQAFKDYLYKTENLPVLKTTTKYAEAADDEAMQLLRAYCKKHRPEMVSFFDTVQEFRKWAKIKSTYIDAVSYTHLDVYKRQPSRPARQMRRRRSSSPSPLVNSDTPSRSAVPRQPMRCGGSCSGHPKKAGMFPALSSVKKKLLSTRWSRRMPQCPRVDGQPKSRLQLLRRLLLKSTPNNP